MRSLQANDMKAYETLYRKYKDPLFNYFLVNTKSKNLAEEQLQDLFLKLYEKKDSFKYQSKFSTWLWTMARNQFIDHKRLSETKLEDSSDSVADDSLDELEAELEAADEMMIKKIEDRQVNLCVNELKASQKEVLTLRIYSELGYDEIAALCSLTLSSVKSLLVRAKEKILECLRKGHVHE
jgi:RNA polymerase sigma-70 factor (ECF subfamily)